MNFKVLVYYISLKNLHLNKESLKKIIFIYFNWNIFETKIEDHCKIKFFYMEIKDLTLLEKIAEKDKDAFNALYSRYNRLFYRWIYTRTHEKEMTKDIIQNFWIMIWTNPKYFKTDENGSAKNFFLQILTYRVLNYLKSYMQRNAGNEALTPDIEDSVGYTHIMEELEEKEIFQMVEEVVEGLPDLTRFIFSLRWRKQYSVRETAKALNVSEKVVRSHYQKALSLLKKRLSKSYPREETDFMLYLILWILFNR